MSEEWEPLEDVPLEWFSNAVFIDEYNFIIASSSSRWTQGSSIQKYNVISNTWSLFEKYPETLTLSSHNICYNAQTNKVHLHGFQQALIIYDCKTKTFDEIHHEREIYNKPSLIEVNGETHLIGGADNNFHLKWNSDKRMFEEIFEFKEWNKGNQGSALIHLKSQNMLMLFGGVDYTAQKAENSIWTHLIGTKQWNKLKNVKMYNEDRPSSLFAYILSGDERNMVLFGGGTDEIWIFNLQNMKWRQSKIRCPATSYSFCAVLSPNKPERDRLLVFGFIRNIKNVPLLPQDIWLLIAKWYSTEYVYLLIEGQKKLWRTPLNVILTA